MGIAGLDWQTIVVALVGGLSQRSDKRASNPPSLDIALNVQFDELGGVQTRKPFGAVIGAGAIAGGGSLANCRRVLEHNGELLVFTSDTLYTWSPAKAAWIARGTHLAVEIDERERFTSPSDAIQCDRATLAGVTVYAWNDNGNVFIAGVDATTGAVTLAPAKIDTTSTSPRLVACATKILLFYVDSSTGTNRLSYRTLDPLALDTVGDNTSATVVTNATNTLAYDVARVPGADVAIVAQSLGGASYRVTLAPPGGIVVTTMTKARTSTGAIAIACTADGTRAQIVRLDANVKGDFVNASTLADVTVNQAIGTLTNADACSHVTACYRTVADSGHFRCYAFFVDGNENSAGSAFQLMVNWVDDAGTIGTAFRIAKRLGLASRAFDASGRVFAWTVFGSATSASTVLGSAPVQLQNTMFLYRDDAFLCAKALATRAGGLLPLNGDPFMATVLPGVERVATNQYAVAATERRLVPTTARSKLYSARAPRDLVFTFDSNRARCTAELSATLYIAGGEVLQYDGTGLYELGWHVFPWFLSTIATTGLMPNGTYAYKVTARWDNANGERDRSTTGTTAAFTVSGGPAGVRFNLIIPIYTTHKLSPAPAIEVWRSEVAPTLDSPLYLDTSNDPSVVSGANRYLANDPTADAEPVFDDHITDPLISVLENNPENGAALPVLAPPAAKIIVDGGTRLFLGAVAGDADRIWYSRERANGRVAEFNDALRVDVPIDGGDVTAIAFVDDTMVVFRETAVYELPGNGFDANGNGQNFGPARVLSLDVGAINQDGVITLTDGVLFKGQKGWYMLSKGFALSYVGAQVYGYDAEPVLGAHVLEAQQQVRILTAARMLVYDYNAGQWFEWSISDGVHACVWNGAHVYLTATGPRQQLSTYSGVDYGLDIETTWLKPAELLVGAARVGEFQPLGEYRSAFALRMRTAFDYKYDGAGNVVYVDDKTWPPSPTTVGSALQLRRGVSRQQCESIKVRLTALGAAVRASIDLGAHTGGQVTTVLEAKSAGVGGNAVTFELVANLTGSNVSITEVGNVVTVHYAPAPPGTSTVAQIEDLITASSTLLQVKTVGNRASTIAADAPFGAVALTGGADSSAPTGEALKLTGIGFRIGRDPKNKLYKRLPASQKA